MIVVGCVAAPFKGDRGAFGLINWCERGAWLRAKAVEFGEDVTFMAALELDARGLEPYAPLLDVLHDLPHAVWTFSLDDGEATYQTNLRTVRVTTGRNMVVEYAMRQGATHVLHLDSDVVPDDDSVRKLLMLDWPVVGGDVPAYCLSGPEVPMRLRFEGRGSWHETAGPYGFPVQEHWNTAGYLLVQREVFEHVRWGHSPIDGLSDDPWFARAAREAGFGPTLVRKDCIGEHEPLGALEARGEDLVIRR